MRLPIETQKKAAGDWAVIVTLGFDGYTLALPEKWVKGGIGRYVPFKKGMPWGTRNVELQGVDQSTARWEADWTIGPGEYKNALSNINYLRRIVNQVWMLVDEGYVDEKHALLAFR